MRNNPGRPEPSVLPFVAPESPKNGRRKARNVPRRPLPQLVCMARLLFASLLGRTDLACIILEAHNGDRWRVELAEEPKVG